MTIRVPRIRRPSFATFSRASGDARTVRVEHDRAAAIRTAIAAAAPDDLVLIAGKGHEDYQIYGTTRRVFSDEQVARECAGGAAMKATLAAFAQSCGGRLVGADAPFNGVSTDSRTVNPRRTVRRAVGAALQW